MDAVLNLPGMLRMYSRYSYRPDDATWREKSMVVGIVVLLHLSVFAVYLFSPDGPEIIYSEMSVSFANPQMQQVDVAPQPKPKPRDPDPAPAEKVVKEETPPAPQNASPQSPVVLDDEPVFSADYLNNPKPSYPMVAKRMGYHGVVRLHVEVLAEGKAGEVKVLQSSGYEILDKAALLTVKTWRFKPAHRFGQAVTQWVEVPIRFQLEDND